MTDTALQHRVIEIIKPLVLPDAEERVNRSYKQWNQIVRDHIRTETGLKLSDGDSRLAIPVRVVQGFPKSLAELIDQYRDPVLWRLILGQPKVSAIIAGLDFLLEDWGQIDKWPSLPPAAKNSRGVLGKCQDIALSLHHAASAAKMFEKVKAIHEDIRGVYRYPTGHGSSVELFWLPIAMVASMLGVAIEDLTVVVLIHELAHGYTHIGRDIDGGRWDDIGFAKSELEVKEGLAQFYTAVISERLASRTPSLFTAYQALLKPQSGPYLAHLQWLSGDRSQIGEIVRFTLIAARTHGTVPYDHWYEMMSETATNLTKPSVFDEQ